MGSLKSALPRRKAAFSQGARQPDYPLNVIQSRGLDFMRGTAAAAAGRGHSHAARTHICRVPARGIPAEGSGSVSTASRVSRCVSLFVTGKP